jgi:hypothetical protein
MQMKKQNKRLFLSLPEEDVKRLDTLREELGMNRSEYIRYLLSGRQKLIPFSIEQKRLVDMMSGVDLHLREICLKDSMKAGDVLYVMEALKDIKAAVNGYGTCGPVDHRPKEVK